LDDGVHLFGEIRRSTFLRPWALKRFGAQAPRLQRVILLAFIHG
jgi:hypothetical protein